MERRCQGLSTPGSELNTLKKYDKIMLLPIEVWYSQNAEYKGINPEELAYITSRLEEKFRAEFEPQYPVVDVAAEDVLVVRMALTGLQKNPLSAARLATSRLPC
nr:DUF3313 family protein [Aliamphritea spongicola]